MDLIAAVEKVWKPLVDFKNKVSLNGLNAEAKKNLYESLIERFERDMISDEPVNSEFMKMFEEYLDFYYGRKRNMTKRRAADLMISHLNICLIYFSDLQSY